MDLSLPREAAVRGLDVLATVTRQEMRRSRIDGGEHNWNVLGWKRDGWRQAPGSRLIDNLQRLKEPVQPRPLFCSANVPIGFDDRVRGREELYVWQGPKGQ